jgi:hypothetical protein
MFHKSKCLPLLLGLAVLASCRQDCDDEEQASVCTIEESPELSGTIDTDTTLVYDPACPTYLVTDDLTVTSEAVLTIEAGVTLVFAQGVSMEIREDAALVADGTAELPITFTGLEAEPGFWKGLCFHNTENGDNLLQNVVLEHGGSAYWYWGDDRVNLLVREATVTVRQTTIRQSAGWGVYLYFADITDFSHNTVTDNASGPAYLYANDLGDLSSGDLSSTSSFSGNDVDFIQVTADTVSDPQAWGAFDVPCLFSGDTEVAAAVTVEPGATFLFDEDAGLYVSADGSFAASGAADDPIVFSGLEETRGYWKGLSFIGTASGANVLDHVVIEYGGSSYWYWGEDRVNLVVREATVAVRNTELRESAGWGFYFYFPDVTAFENNEIYANVSGPGYLRSNNCGQLSDTSSYAGNDIDYVVLEADTIDVSQTWAALDVPYLLLGYHSVEAALTIMPGAELIFEEEAGLEVKSTGGLDAQGNATAPIVFSGAQATAGFWKGLCFHGQESGPNILDNVTVEYGGSSYWFWGDDLVNILSREASVTINNSTIQHSAGWGVYSYYGQVSTDNVTYNQNASGDYHEEP